MHSRAGASCTAAAVHVDARKLVECVARGDFQGGLAALANSVPLPLILAHICDHPCHAQCKRAEVGEAIEIGLLERACAEYGVPAPAIRLQASRNQSVAVVGGGLSGVAAAVGLAGRGYSVTLFEARPRLLDRLRSLEERILPVYVIDADLAALDRLGVVARCETPVLDSIVRQFDALIAPGPNR